MLNRIGDPFNHMRKGIQHPVHISFQLLKFIVAFPCFQPFGQITDGHPLHQLRHSYNHPHNEEGDQQRDHG
ncbi:hypothetical protein D3C73_1508740 [compost metagenome]